MAKFNKDKALDIIKNGTEEEQRHLLDDIARRLDTKRYGLVWEHGGDDEDSLFEAEDVVVQCVSGIAYPKSRDDLSLSPSSGFGNLLLEGDNYAWLKILEQTHKGKIDVVYIDPPYNTGSKDGSDGFKYNDSFVRDGDVFQHSMWLDFMERRLRLAKRLMAEEAVIFINIDDRELAPLLLLCDEVFGADNFEGIVHWRRRSNQPNDKNKLIGLVAEHIIVYAKNSAVLKAFGVGKVPLTGQFTNPDNDPRGPWASKPAKAANGQGGTRYQITAPDGTVFDETWLFAEDTYNELVEDGRIYFPVKKGKYGPPRKKYYMSERQGEGQCANNWWTVDDAGSNQDASEVLKDIFSGEYVFNNSKPVKLMKRIIGLGSIKNDAVILDFFAGSGTTAHAVEELNNEDGKHRQWILITNNEDVGEDDGNPDTGICRDITKPRIDAVITGIRPDGSKYSDGLDSGYAYYQYDFLPRTPYREKNARTFQRPAVLDPFVAIKYGAHKIATDEETMAFAYQSKDNIIVLAFGQATREDIDQTLDDLDIDETLPVIAIVPDGCPLDMKHQDDLDVVPFSKLTDNSYLQGRK